MAKVYLKPGDKVETLCRLTYGGDRGWQEFETVEGDALRYFREDESHDEGGQWFQVRYDFGGTRGSNPHWGSLYYDDEDPGY